MKYLLTGIAYDFNIVILLSLYVNYASSIPSRIAPVISLLLLMPSESCMKYKKY